MPKLRKVDGRLMVHEQSESERQQLRDMVHSPVITMNESTVACRG